MTKRKISAIVDPEFTTIKRWLENGEKQRQLDKLFLTGIICEVDTSNAIRKAYPMFQSFSPKVFNAHFNKTKAKHGFHLTNKTGISYFFKFILHIYNIHFFFSI